MEQTAADELEALSGTGQTPEFRLTDPPGIGNRESYGCCAGFGSFPGKGAARAGQLPGLHLRNVPLDFHLAGSLHYAHYIASIAPMICSARSISGWPSTVVRTPSAVNVSTLSMNAQRLFRATWL